MNLLGKRAAWAGLTAAGVLLAFAPAVTGQRTLSQRDTDQLYAPVRTLVVEALRAGRLPLWNPHEAAGKPLFAEGLHSVLHPVSLAAALLAPSSIDALLLGYLLAAALGAFLLARTLGASPPACAAAGLGFALSGFSVSMTGNLVFLAGLATLPWLLAAARLAGAGSPWGPLLAALATATAFLAGDVQVALVGVALGLLLAAEAGAAAAEGAAATAGAARGGWWRGAGRALAGMVPGLLLAGVQVAATQELLPRTYRSLELTPDEKTRWALAPGRLLEWLVPGLFRGPLGEDPISASGAPLGVVFAESLYLGAPLLFAAVLGVATRRRAARWLALAALVLLWLALGHHLGARQALDWVPVWSRFRYAEKLMAPLGLCLALLAAHGVDAFAAAPLSRAWTRALATAALLAGAVGVALLSPGAAAGLASRLLGDQAPFYRATLAAGLPHLAGGLVALLVADRLRGGPARAATLALLLALAPAAAVTAGAHFGDPAARLTPASSSAIWRLEGDGPVPRVAQPLAGRFDPRSGQDYVDAAARNGAALLLPSFNVAARVDSLEPYSGFEPRRLTTLHRSVGDRWTRDFRRFGLSHLTLPLPPEPGFQELTARAVEGGRLVARDEARGVEVWAVPHRPWAFFAGRAVAHALPQDAHRELLALMARGEDQVVVVEAAETPATAPGRVLSVVRGPEAVRVEAEAGGPALLVVQDAWWPGWTATIDGQPAELLAADLIVRAVRWPPGLHVLEMTYDPPGVRLGLWLTAAGALFTAGLAAWGGRRSRTGGPG